MNIAIEDLAELLRVRYSVRFSAALAIAKRLDREAFLAASHEEQPRIFWATYSSFTPSQLAGRSKP